MTNDELKINRLVLEHFFKNPQIKPDTYRFSSDGTDALLVVEELHRREGAVFIINASNEKNEPLWVVGNKPESMILASKTEGRMPENDAFAASASTFPMAVCKAALKSVNAKI